MNEEIFEAAKEFAYTRYNPEVSSVMTVANVASELSFQYGAMWQRDHAWHNVLQIPKEGKIVIAMLKIGPLVCGPNHNDWKQNTKELGIIAWAYFDDLTPTSFDNIIKENIEILKRLNNGK